MFITVRNFIADEAGDNLVVYGIILAITGIIAYGAFGGVLKPKIKSGVDVGGSNIDNAAALTY